MLEVKGQVVFFYFHIIYTNFHVYKLLMSHVKKTYEYCFTEIQFSCSCCTFNKISRPIFTNMSYSSYVIEGIL